MDERREDQGIDYCHWTALLCLFSDSPCISAPVSCALFREGDERIQYVCAVYKFYGVYLSACSRSGSDIFLSEKISKQVASIGRTAVIGVFVANLLLLLYNQRENNKIYHFLCDG